MLRASIARTGELALAGGTNLATRLIERVVPTGDALTARRGETPKDVVVRVGRALAGEVLAVQGPPGTGKTYAGSALIRELLDAGLRVGCHGAVARRRAQPPRRGGATRLAQGRHQRRGGRRARRPQRADPAHLRQRRDRGGPRERRGHARRGHRLALVARRHGRRGRRARHRRGWSVLARQRGGRRAGRALARPARRPAAADPADQGGPPVRIRRVGPRPPAHHGRRPASTTSSPPTEASSSTARTACTRA